MLVPDIWRYPPPGRALQMFTPAKLVSIFAPALLNEAGVRSGFSAATDTHHGERPGQSTSGVPAPLFPAAHTHQTLFRSLTSCIAAVMVRSSEDEPSDMDTISAPCS